MFEVKVSQGDKNKHILMPAVMESSSNSSSFANSPAEAATESGRHPFHNRTDAPAKTTHTKKFPHTVGYSDGMTLTRAQPLASTF